MNWSFAKYWPPAKSLALSIVWCLLLGFALQLVVPFLLIAIGLKDAAWLAWFPGLLPIICATGGWFASITPIGYVLIFAINTLVYGGLLLLGLRGCLWCRNRIRLATN